MEDIAKRIETAFSQSLVKITHSGDKAYFENKWEAANTVIEKQKVLILLKDYLK